MSGKGSQRRPIRDSTLDEIQCIQCGNCCRVGGTCDWLKWSRDAKSIRNGSNTRHNADFEGTCPELRANGQCGFVLKVLSGELDDVLHTQAKLSMKQSLRGVCTAPELRWRHE
jgi:hypothetical protein